MTPHDTALADELLAMARRDAEVRERLAAAGQLFGGYHAEMEAVHTEHGARLAAIIAECGFPSQRLVGGEGARAAWLIVQHAISMPALQRSALPLLRELAADGKFPPAYVAMLEDRIRCFEGKPQRFGTQFDWDEDGQLSPLPIEDVCLVDALRAEAGLPPLQRSIDDQRALAREQRRQPPRDRPRYEAERDVWLRRVGWRQ